MPRYFWVSASIAMLVAAFAMLAIGYRQGALADGPDRAAAAMLQRESPQQVATYEVPPARGEAIRNTLNAVLLANKDGVQPVGSASLPMPDRVVVSAPARMQDSIRKAIASLSVGETQAANSAASAAVDIWLVEGSSSGTGDDPRLQGAKPALDEARRRFGHTRYQLRDRAMVVATLGGSSVHLDGPRSRAEIRLRPHDAGSVEAQIDLVVNEDSGNKRFDSNLLLAEGQWQLVGLLPGAGGNAPERLLLVRQTAVKSSAAAGQ
jgi:hypothetical protein